MTSALFVVSVVLAGQQWSVSAGTVDPAGGPVIEVWYGNEQSYGANGRPQPYFNLLGNVSDSDGVAAISYSVNDSVDRPLTIGPDLRRLADEGDFNADIPQADLRAGANEVVLTAVDVLGNESTETVSIEYFPNRSWPRGDDIDWSSADRIDDVAQVVDGEWSLDSGGLRSIGEDYDRIVVFGDDNWVDYVVTVPITINRVDPEGFPRPTSGFAAGVGFLLRWPGHTDDPVPDRQPKTGWIPSGAIGWFSWSSLDEVTLDLEELVVGPPVEITAGDTLWLKMSVETTATGAPLYRLKSWPDGQPEPVDWMVESEGTPLDPISGSLGLLSHHVDATFGNVVVEPLNLPEPTFDARVDGAGVISVDPVGESYRYGDRVEMTAIPDDGQIFTGWSGSFEGSENPLRFSVDGPTDVTARFVAENAEPTVTGVVVDWFVDSAIVRWTTDKATTGSVDYGSTTAYGDGPMISGELATTHSVVLTDLEPASDYHAQISAVDEGRRATITPDVAFSTLPPSASGLVSSDFSACRDDETTWSFVDPLGDSAASFDGERVTISVPGETGHGVVDLSSAPRLTQPVADADFDVEVKFESMIAEEHQVQGVLVGSDNGDTLEFAFVTAGPDIYVSAGATVAGRTNVFANVMVDVGDAMFLRVSRAGDVWSAAASADGESWSAVAGFRHALIPSDVGIVASNGGAVAPDHLVIADYFFDALAPIHNDDATDEDCR